MRKQKQLIYLCKKSNSLGKIILCLYILKMGSFLKTMTSKLLQEILQIRPKICTNLTFNSKQVYFLKNRPNPNFACLI